MEIHSQKNQQPFAESGLSADLLRCLRVIATECDLLRSRLSFVLCLVEGGRAGWCNAAFARRTVQLTRHLLPVLPRSALQSILHRSAAFFGAASARGALFLIASRHHEQHHQSFGRR